MPLKKHIIVASFWELLTLFHVLCKIDSYCAPPTPPLLHWLSGIYLRHFQRKPQNRVRATIEQQSEALWQYLLRHASCT